LKAPYFFFILVLKTLSYAQETERFDAHNFNSLYLEHLVKTGVDEVRKLHDCDILVNDSVLYVASSHHSNYLVRSRMLTHTEDDSVLTKTPQDRVVYFGATNYRVGENILFTPYNRIVQGKDGSKFDTHTYRGIADAMVNAWVNSPGHFKNMITKDYQLTGLAVALDTITGRVYACQKFAMADYQYSFNENKEMFPYSNYVPPKIATSFDGIKRQLIEDYLYNFKLRHDKQEDCESCDTIVSDPPPITLRIERNMFILRVEDSDFVKHLMDKRQDGFAVEIVSFEDYVCGNPAYYTKPSRRNGQLKLNGRILKPVYKKDLYRGYKKRKSRDDVKFVSYIFQADSVSFFKRFGRYKLDRYNFQYFEIVLGKVPRDLTGFWAHNLVYIQDGQICHIDYLTAYCGQVIEEYQPAEFIPASATDNCVLAPEERFLHFSIPFEKGKSDFTKDDIDPFIRSISSLSYDLDSVCIHAYSSIEGDSVTNENLQIMRANNIARVLNQNQSKDVLVRISTSADWIGFYEAVAKSSKWKYMSTMSQKEVLDEFTKIGVEEIEPILKTERRGEIDLYCTINVHDQNLEYFLNKELKSLQHKIDSLSRAKRNLTDAVAEFSILYECIHSKVVQGKISPEFLAAIKMPAGYRDDHPLVQKFVMYGYEFKESFSKNKEWVENHKKDEDFIHTSCSDPKHILPEFIYILVRNTTEYYQQQELGDFDKLQHLLNMVEKMGNYYQSDSVAQLNIDRLNFNLNVLLLNSVFASEPMKYSGNAIKSIAQLYQFYEKYGQMNGSKAIKLAKTAVYFQQVYPAIELMTPFATEDSVLAYMMPLGYQHITQEGSAEWYNTLIALSDQMDTNIWCDMFFGECQIPFQAFDHEGLRDIFCERCMEHNDFVQSLMGKTKR
jgi:hypothetical protein